MSNAPSPPPPPTRPRRLLDRVRYAARIRHMSPRTEKAYVGWTRRFVLFHGKRHPDEMGAPEVAAFLSHLAVRSRVSAVTQNQACSALLFLYREVLEREFDGIESVVRARASRPLPVVLSRDELKRSQMARRVRDNRVRYMIGDVINAERVKRAMQFRRWSLF